MNRPQKFYSDTYRVSGVAQWGQRFSYLRAPYLAEHLPERRKRLMRPPPTAWAGPPHPYTIPRVSAEPLEIKLSTETRFILEQFKQASIFLRQILLLLVHLRLLLLLLLRRRRLLLPLLFLRHGQLLVLILPPRHQRPFLPEDADAAASRPSYETPSTVKRG